MFLKKTIAVSLTRGDLDHEERLGVRFYNRESATVVGSRSAPTGTPGIL